MADIIRFPLRAADRHKRRPAKVATTDSVIIFPGVRYERPASAAAEGTDVAAAGEGARRPRRTR